MKIKNIICSWDICIAFLITITIYLVLPDKINDDLAKDFYKIGISVLSIVFSIYFAAFAIIISASDDKFVLFLEEEGHFTELLSHSKFTIILLFISLMFSLFCYGLTKLYNGDCVGHQSKYYLSIFIFLFIYSLFAALIAANDSISYAKYRTKFLKLKKKNG